MITLNKISKRFGSRILFDDVTITFNEGNRYGLTGPNGAGKSTLVNLICGLLKPDHGHIFLGGTDLSLGKREPKMCIGLVPQDLALFEELSAEENLRMFGGLYGLSGERLKQRIQAVLQLVSLADRAKDKPVNFSGGMKRRLNIAAAMLHEPELLILDEPTSGVDPITRKEFWTHINGMVKKGVSIMVTTHFMDEAEYCDKIMLIYKGKNIASGTPDELKALVGPNASMQDAFITLVKKYDKEDL